MFVFVFFVFCLSHTLDKEAKVLLFLPSSQYLVLLLQGVPLNETPRRPTLASGPVPEADEEVLPLCLLGSRLKYPATARWILPTVDTSVLLLAGLYSFMSDGTSITMILLF